MITCKDLGFELCEGCKLLAHKRNAKVQCAVSMWHNYMQGFPDKSSMITTLIQFLSERPKGKEKAFTLMKHFYPECYERLDKLMLLA